MPLSTRHQLQQSHYKKWLNPGSDFLSSHSGSSLETIWTTPQPASYYEAPALPSVGGSGDAAVS